eukprot:CAMPEP_0201716346 /NCGR_PEP_ID=MMETSP0593-20130828/2349_1 /ASSEMBLY_ACC=CAM_ASM_000672 /TAXON_ID=267983 /ORGANISM="Skeletonema japonicum, Strain CCMP2506" /LENGTH=825 /DNA_ID=CAMNT_0048206137 /DNA_START=56 /DNA_END=2533 /DNA_ORIENTATION=+
MPRIHGQNQQRGSSHSRRAGSASGDKQRSHSGAKTTNNGDIIVIDDFGDFSYDDEQSQKNEIPSSAGHSKQQRRRTKQSKFALEDTSSEEDEDDEELPEPSYKSSNSKSSTTRKKLTSKKKKSAKARIDPKPKRLTPTVSSPKITLSSIAKKDSSVRPSSNNNNKNASSKRGASSKKEPIGKPIKSSVSRGKKSKNDENYDNDAEQLDEGRQRASRSRKKKGAADTTLSTKHRNVSFSSNTKENGDDMKSSSVMNGKDGKVGVDITTDTTSINEGHSNQIQVLPLRAIAIDNRVLPTFTADSTSQKSFFEQLPDFLEGMMQKGALQPQLPRRNSNANVEGTSIIASLVHGTSSSRIDGKGITGARIEQSVVPRASFLLEEASGGRVADSERNEWISQFLTPINHGLVSAVRNDTDVEIGFGAQDSWKYFGDLVDAIEYKLYNTTANSQQSSRPKHPCTITLFTTDSTFFADSDPASHSQGLENFWKRISPAFQSNTIAAMSIVIVGTKSDDLNVDPTKMSSDDFRRSIQCINEIRRNINELSESMKSSSEWIFDEWNGKQLVNLQLEYIEGTNISFQTLQQKCIQGSFYETYPTAHGRLSFDLPETIDGIMCSISLDLQYSTLPHSIDSNETLSLVTDMKRISALPSSNVEVIHSIPLSNVDSVMIYGIPMTARAAIDDDYSRYNEMKMLNKQMWKYLSSNDIGLVLRVRFEEDDGHDDDRHPRSREELFLLVCEQAVAVEKPCVPNNDSKYDRSEALGVTVATKHKTSCHGMLFRYASKRQMLRFVNEDEIEEDENSAEELQYQDYIERSIEMLATTGLNPLLL